MGDLNGQTLGQFTIIDELGHGGMATVYRGQQHSVNREVAIKVLPPQLMLDDGFKQRFYSEVDIISHLQHPHILPVYDFGVEGDVVYIVMALIGGGTLSGLIDEGPMELVRTSALIRQIASALDYAHGQGIIHRDVKPSNVLLDQQGNAYLADFGLAKATDSSAKLSATGMIGTPAYMAPDMADPKTVSYKVDVYALAVILFEMLTGRLPYESDSAIGLIIAHTNKPIPNLHDYNPDLPAELQAIIERGLAKSPDARYPTAGSLADDLEAVISGKGQAEIPTGLLFTDTTGRVIFVDGYFLKMTHRSAGQARNLIGMPMHELLGIEAGLTQKLLADIGKIGQVRELALTIQDGTGKPISVTCSGAANYDERGKSVGADLSLRYAVGPEGEADVHFSKPSTMFDTSDREYVHEYVTAQINALRVLLIRIGGQRPADRLEQIINETAERNEWSVEMRSSQLIFGPGMRSDVYRALVARAIAYSGAIIGKSMVLRQMEAVDEQLGERAKQLADELNLRQIVAEL